MLRCDEDALICDLAEVYHVLDYRQLPPLTLATLAAGLGENSRVAMVRLGLPVRMETLLLATVADRLGLLLWAKTADGQKNRNRPPQLVSLLMKKEEDQALRGYRSGEAFEKAKQQLLDGGDHGSTHANR